MIFVDTGAWFASIVPTDPNHNKAADWLQNNSEILFTTDYIVDETLTLLRARGERSCGHSYEKLVRLTLMRDPSTRIKEASTNS